MKLRKATEKSTGILRLIDLNNTNMSKKSDPITMAAPNQIYLDDTREAPVGWRRCYWPQEVIDLLKQGGVSHISLDHDLGDDTIGTGYDVLSWLEEAVYTGQENPSIVPMYITIHSANPVGRQRMQNAIDSIFRFIANANRS